MYNFKEFIAEEFVDEKGYLEKIEDDKLKKAVEGIKKWANKEGIEVNFYHYFGKIYNVESVSMSFPTKIGNLKLEYEEKMRKAGISDYSYSQQYERTGKGGWYLEYPGSFNRYNYRGNKKATSIANAKKAAMNLVEVSEKFEQILEAFGQPIDKKKFNFESRSGKFNIEASYEDFRVNYLQWKNIPEWKVILPSKSSGRRSRFETFVIEEEDFKDLENFVENLKTRIQGEEYGLF